MDIMQKLEQAGIIPVVVLDRTEDAVPTAKALLKGGIGVMEITFRTAAARDALRAVAENVPEMIVGAGTVLNVAQCEAASQAGAQFIVSPGLDIPLTESCIREGLAVIPGCVTPSEIMAILALGLKTVKFFPASVYGGLDAMKALSGPFPGLKFIPTGGVNAGNLREYIAAPFISAAGGSWMCKKADIAAGKFDQISALSEEAVRIIREVRQ